MAGCTEGCKDEFQRSNVLLTHPHPEYFVTSQWKSKCTCMNIFYLVYRWTSAMGFIAMTILLGIKYADTTSEGRGLKFFAFVSNWSFLVLTLDTIIQFITAVCGFSQYRKKGIWEKVFSYMPWYLKMQWVITNIATCSGFLITVFFWATVFSPDHNLDISSYNIHVTNSAYLLLNLFITAMPVRIYHVFHTCLYFAVFISFDAILQIVNDQPPTYSQVNWKDSPIGSIPYIVILVIAGPLVIWFICYALYRIRLSISDCLLADTQKDKALVVSDVQTKGEDNPKFVAGSTQPNYTSMTPHVPPMLQQSMNPSGIPNLQPPIGQGVPVGNNALPNNGNYTHSGFVGNPYEVPPNGFNTMGHPTSVSQNALGTMGNNTMIAQNGFSIIGNHPTTNHAGFSTMGNFSTSNPNGFTTLNNPRTTVTQNTAGANSYQTLPMMKNNKSSSSVEETVLPSQGTPNFISTIYVNGD